ncbi:MAG TPA: hypothetical protein VKS23_06970 [Thermoanaerobaculia bacterium]|nr:hypothetical protein [Thermoanaerobaculia bacterium]
MTNRQFIALAVGSAALLGVWLYGPTFGASYAHDDMDFLNLAADLLAGRAPFWSVLFRPQGDHFVPVMRFLLTASAAVFGTNATPLRLLVFAAHLLSALFVALTARRVLQDDAAGLVAGICYVLPCGFSSMLVWFPSAGGVPIGIAGVTGALAAIVHADRLGRRRAGLLAAAGCVFALACDNTLVPLLSAPFFVSIVERRRAGDRRVASGLEFFLALLALLATRLAYTRQTGAVLHTEPLVALKRFVFLASVAPFRYLFPGPSVLQPYGVVESFPKMEAAFGIVVALLAAAAILVLLTPSARRGATVALAALPAGLGYLALVAIARWNYPYAELFDADRYFFLLLISAALFAGSAAAALHERLRADRRLTAALLGLALATFGLEALLHRRAMLYRATLDVYAAHARRFATLTRLAGMLADEARSLPPDAQPLQVPDTNLFFPDVHNGRISTRFLLTISNRRPTRRLVLARGPVGSRDASVLNGVFGAWDREMGVKPWFLVESGEIRDLHRPGVVDFTISAQEADVLSGFYAWGRPSRWMGGRGVVRAVLAGPRLRVELACPVDALAAARPPAAIPVLDVALEDADGREPVPLGAIRPEGSAWRAYDLAIPEDAWERRRGTPTRVVLTSRTTWRPAEVLPGSADRRNLSVEVFRISFVEK